MSAVDEILSQVPLDQLAAQLGVDETSAEQAVRQAVPALLGGMEANAQDPQGAASLEEALSQHLGGSLDLSSVDIEDGDAIVGHVFGDQRDQVVNTLGGQGAGGGIMSKLLPMLAPLVLSWLAGKFLGGGQPTPAGQTGAAEAPAGGGVSSLDDLLGGASGGGAGGIGDVLGGLLGGGGGEGGGTDQITDLLGGLLGGGRKG